MRERALRLVLENSGQTESFGAAIVSVVAKIGCAANALNDWAQNAVLDRGDRASVTAEMAERMKALDHAKRNAVLLPEIERVFHENYEIDGVGKVWHQMHRKGCDVAR